MASDHQNPFASPQFPSEPMEGPSGGRFDSPGIVDALAGTRPWVLFLGILGFIATGLFVLVAVIGIVSTMAGGPNGFPAAIGLGVVYLVIAVVYAAASYYLFSYGQRIGDYLNGRDVRQLEEALFAQKSFWKLLGIVVAIYLGLVALIIPVMLFISLAG